MSVANAAAVIARDLARRAISGKMSPLEIAEQADRLCPSADCPPALTGFPNYSDWYEYGSPNERETREAFDSAVLSMSAASVSA
jgi:hypothetical protein